MTSLLSALQYSKRSERIDTSEIRKVFDLAASIKNPINLSIGQPDFAVPQAVKESMVQAILDDKNAYTQTQGILPLREALSSHWQKSGIDIHPENIVVSTGVASILFMLFEVLFNEGDTIILIEPYFLIYKALADFHKLNIIYLDEDYTQEDIETLLKQPGAENIKAAIFSTPSNPTGKILSKDQFRSLTPLVDKGTLLISDEIYNAYDYDNKFSSCAAIHPQSTVTLGGFSKSHAMTGLRVGYIGVPSNLSAITAKIATLQQYSIVCSPQPAQWAAITALETPIESELKLMKNRRDLVVSKLKDKVSFRYPDGAFYLFAEINRDSSEFIVDAIENRLLVVPGYIFSRNKKSIRISYAQKEEILEEGLDIFVKLATSSE